MEPGAAAYDEIADWYEDEFLRRGAGGDPIGALRAADDLLGVGGGDICLDLGTGTGIHAGRLRNLGWSPVGIDLSSAMLRRAHDRLPIVKGDAERLPFADACLPVVSAMLVHTDMPRYAAVVSEVARVLRQGGVFVHVGVHPCFCGGFADRTDPEAVIIQPGYADGHWTKASWTDQGVRDKVGATHLPLPALLHAFLEAGLSPERFMEGGAPIPTVLAIKARKPG